MFGKSTGNLRIHFNKAKEEIQGGKQYISGRQSLLSEEQREQVYKHISNSYINSKLLCRVDIQSYVKEEFDIEISTSVVNSLIKSSKGKFETVNALPIEEKRLEIQKEVVEQYINWIT